MIFCRCLCVANSEIISLFWVCVCVLYLKTARHVACVCMLEVWWRVWCVCVCVCVCVCECLYRGLEAKEWAGHLIKAVDVDGRGGARYPLKFSPLLSYSNNPYTDMLSGINIDQITTQERAHRLQIIHRFSASWLEGRRREKLWVNETDWEGDVGSEANSAVPATTNILFLHVGAIDFIHLIYKN